MSTRGVLALCITLALLGWTGLAFFTYYNPPDVWNRWIVVVALWPTLMTTFLPVVYAVHWSLKRGESNMSHIARQSALVALFITLCVALRMMQALDWAKMSLLLLLLVLTEVWLSSREEGS